MQTLTINQIDRSDAAARSARASAEAKEISARHLLIATRASLGFLLLASGANGFLHFLPQSSPLIVEGQLGALMTSPLAFAIEAVLGALLLANRYVTAAIALSAPVVAGLFVVHAAAHATMSLPIVVFGLELYLLRACVDRRWGFPSTRAAR